MMWRLTWRGLLSHWLRFVMTAMAIILGISFLVGSFVITDTIRAAFDDLFAQTTKGTDAVLRYEAQFKSDFGIWPSDAHVRPCHRIQDNNRLVIELWPNYGRRRRGA